MTLNGGAMQQTTQQPDGTTDPEFSDVSIKSGGYGIIDVAWKVGARETLCLFLIDMCDAMLHFHSLTTLICMEIFSFRGGIQLRVQTASASRF